MYDTLVALHVISAVIGFGAVAVTGVYGGMARRSNQPGDDEARRYFAGPLRAEWVLLAVPFLGLAALLSGPKRHDVGEVWVLAAAGLWLIAAALLVHVVRPAEQRVRAATPAEPDGGTPAEPDGGTPAEPGPRTDPAALGDLRSAGRRLMRASLVTDLLFVVALALMVAQPT